MGQQIPITTSFRLPDGREVVIETGKLATQAHGSVVVIMDKTIQMSSSEKKQWRGLSRKICSSMKNPVQFFPKGNQAFRL